MAQRHTTSRQGQTVSSKSKARFISSTVICLFVVAAIGEGFACAYLWDRMTKAEFELATRSASTSKPESDSDQSKGIDGASNTEDGAGNAEELTRLLEDARTSRLEVVQQNKKLRFQQDALDLDNARSLRRLEYLTERLDAIVHQREQLAVANDELRRQLASGVPLDSVRASRVSLTDIEDDGWRAVPEE